MRRRGRVGKGLERETERERERASECGVCERQRQRERERQTDREGQREKDVHGKCPYTVCVVFLNVQGSVYECVETSRNTVKSELERFVHSSRNQYSTKSTSLLTIIRCWLNPFEYLFRTQPMPMFSIRVQFLNEQYR